MFAKWNLDWSELSWTFVSYKNGFDAKLHNYPVGEHNSWNIPIFFHQNAQLMEYFPIQ